MYLQLWFLGLTSVQACWDDGDGRFDKRMGDYYHQQRLHQRAFPGSTVPDGSENMRSITWGDLNFIHVTDTHGWLTGHPTEEISSGDWGDFVSFNEHMQAEADRRGVDLVVVETGDRHEGSGLASATEIDGSVSQLVFAQAKFDVLNVGNHELYRQDFALQEYNMLRPFYGDAYLASNVEYYIDHDWLPAGNRYRVFTTKNLGKRILAFGFIFNFDKYDIGTRVIKIQESVQQQWFKDALTKEDYDVIMVTGHNPVRGFDEYDAIIDAVRELNATVPIQGFGGHTHVRDYRVFDDRAVALESGKYLDTIGWASVKFGSEGLNGTDVAFTRRYIDFNPQNLARHANLTLDTFTTEKGAAVSQQIREYRKDLKLDKVLAQVPQDYFLQYAPYPGPNSLVSLTEEKILPLLGGDLKDQPHLTIFGTDLLRYDLRKGNFIEDSKYIVNPHRTNWMHVEVPIRIANSIMNTLNPKISKRDIETSVIPNLGAPKSTYIPAVATASPNISAKYGYASVDDFGSDGDDVVREALPVYKYPPYVAHAANIDNTTTSVDLIFTERGESVILKVLRDAGLDPHPELYEGESMQDLMLQYFTNLD